MLKNQKGFAHHFLLPLIVIVLIGAIGFLVYHKSQHQTTQSDVQGQGQNTAGVAFASIQVYNQLPDCHGDQLLTAMPLDPGTPYDLLPLGLVNGTGGHTTPSDHMYFNFPGVDEVMNVRSPGNLYITKILRAVRTVHGVTSEDTSITTMPCKQVVFYFNHTQLAASLSKYFPDTTQNSPYVNCQTDTQPGETAHDCSILATEPIKVKTGDVLATVHVNSNQTGWDFGGYDSRKKPLAFANPARLNTSQNDFHGLNPSVPLCPIDYFPTAVQKTAFASPSLAKRPDSSKCGEVMQDKPGTIQGNWYLDSSGGYVGDWTKFLSINHFFKDPTIAQISAGGTLGSGGIMGWRPSQDGNDTIDPEPSQTTTGTLYCFHAGADSAILSDYNFTFGHKILLELTDTKTLKAEYQTGSCTGHDSFSNPLTYYR